MSEGWDFSTFLDRDADSFKKAPPLPVGHYTFSVIGFEYGKSDKKQTPFCRFRVRPISAEPDVDETELAAAQKIKPLGERELRLDFYLTEAATYRLTDFLKKLNINTNRPLKKALEDVGGAFFKAYVIQEPSSKPGSDEIYNNISATLPA